MALVSSAASSVPVSSAPCKESGNDTVIGSEPSTVSRNKLFVDKPCDLGLRIGFEPTRVVALFAKSAPEKPPVVPANELAN